MDPFLLEQPIYNPNQLEVIAIANAFKYSDRSGITFTCSMQLCLKREDEECVKITVKFFANQIFRTNVFFFFQFQPPTCQNLVSAEPLANENSNPPSNIRLGNREQNLLPIVRRSVADFQLQNEIEVMENRISQNLELGAENQDEAKKGILLFFARNFSLIWIRSNFNLLDFFQSHVAQFFAQFKPRTGLILQSLSIKKMAEVPKSARGLDFSR